MEEDYVKDIGENMKTILRRLYNRFFRREQFAAFKRIYNQVVIAGYPTHEATVLNNVGGVFTGEIVGFSDDHLYLMHTFGAVSYHNFYDVLSVDPTQIDDKAGEMFKELHTCGIGALAGDESKTVQFPRKERWEMIKGAKEERQRVQSRLNTLTRTKNSRCVYLVLSPYFDFYRDAYHYPHELTVYKKGM